MFSVEVQSESEVVVLTPLVRADGTSVVLYVEASGDGFTLSAPIEVLPNNSVLTLSRLRSEQVDRLCGTLGVSLEGGVAGLLGRQHQRSRRVALVRLAQAVVCMTFIAKSKEVRAGNGHRFTPVHPVTCNPVVNPVVRGD